MVRVVSREGVDITPSSMVELGYNNAEDEMQYLVVLHPDYAKKYDSIVFQGNKWLGRHKGHGAMEELPVGAFRLAKLDEVFPDFGTIAREAVKAALAEQKGDLAKEIADIILSELDKDNGVVSEGNGVPESLS